MFKMKKKIQKISKKHNKINFLLWKKRLKYIGIIWNKIIGNRTSGNTLLS